MSMVRFATLCDLCEARSEEYTSWPSCRSCMLDVCPNCYEEETLKLGEGECNDSILCDVCSCLEILIDVDELYIQQSEGDS